MAELAGRFPDAIARGATGGPGFSTTVVRTFSGVETRNINRDGAEHRYNVSQGIKTGEDVAQLDAFFRKARGRANTFRFKDWGDYRLAATDSRLVLVSGTTYQLCKVYGADEPALEEVREIRRIVAGTLRVYSGVTLLSEGVDYTVDVDTGRITTASTSLSAACEFDVPCRFDVDQKTTELVYRSSASRLLVRWDDIDLVEVFDE